MADYIVLLQQDAKEFLTELDKIDVDHLNEVLNTVIQPQ